MSFAIQFMSICYLADHSNELTERLIPVPEEIDQFVAERKLRMMGKSIDCLTEEQKEYLS
mgnify:CR=1 FL=1